jgi:hypothetical protein
VIEETATDDEGERKLETRRQKREKGETRNQKLESGGKWRVAGGEWREKRCGGR